MAITIAAILLASSASAFDPSDLRKLNETGDCIRCNLAGADLEVADLNGANLNGANLRWADLMGADLTRGIMIDTIFCTTIMPDRSFLSGGG
jgi:uncharacterized protein YjbI with pentapeptide repeats